jgi:hypothetical protein
VGSEPAAIEQFAFERCEETLAHGVVVCVTDRSGRRPDAGILASVAEGQRCVLRALIAMMDDILGLAGSKRHIKGVEHDAGLEISR